MAILVRSINAKTKRGTITDYEAPLPSPNGYKGNITPVAFISSEDERIDKGEPSWINEMYPLNQTELDKFLNTVGKQDLNYTICKISYYLIFGHIFLFRQLSLFIEILVNNLL